MSWDSAFWWPHKVIVRRANPAGGLGPKLGEPVPLDKAEVKDQHRLVRSADGREVVSSSTVTVPIETDLTVGSEVTVWPGTASERKAKVIQVGRDENDPPLPSHLILMLE